MAPEYILFLNLCSFYFSHSLTIFINRPASFRKRRSVMLIYSWLNSMPMQSRCRRSATRPVVPAPKKGSRTMHLFFGIVSSPHSHEASQFKVETTDIYSSPCARAFCLSFANLSAVLPFG